jgi:isocitrate dehydrogenase
MTKDLAVLIDPAPQHLTTEAFLDALDEGLRAKMAG